MTGTRYGFSFWGLPFKEGAFLPMFLPFSARHLVHDQVHFASTYLGA